MTSIQQKLTRDFSNSFEGLGFEGRCGLVDVSNRPDLGQFQCNGALIAARTGGDASGAQQTPRSIAQQVIDALQFKDRYADLSLAGPGFINIRLTDDYLAAHLTEIASDERLGCSPVQTPERVVIDFGGPNVAKPMHVGHLRSSLIGDSLQRLYRFMGHHVISDIHLGDWGTPLGMLIIELGHRQPDLPYFDPKLSGPYPVASPVTLADLQEMYPAAVVRCRENETDMAAALQATVEFQQGRPGYRALWCHFVDISVRELKEDFDSLGVSFDHWFGESDYRDQLDPLLERLKLEGRAVVSHGALIIPLAHPGDKKEMPPLMLAKSDGGHLYGTTDLATIVQRVEDFQADRILYVVDARQSLHFNQLFRAARQTDLIRNSTVLTHIPFGTINGPDGKPFKTRAGGVMRLKELISMVTAEAGKRMQETGVAKDYDEAEQLDIANKVGLAALKYADLMNHRTSDYIFDLEKFTKFDGRTGPYLLYTVVRIKSILRKADEQGFGPGPIQSPSTDSERALMLTLARLPEAVENSYLNDAPNHLGAFVYDLAQMFNRFYTRHHILSEENTATRVSWLSLLQLCLSEFELTLKLLGIKTAERM